MNKVDLLDRHYQNFIDLKNPKDFFIGMADYLEYADLVPEFEQVSAEILEEPKPLRKKLVELEKVALVGLKKRRDELWSYYSKQKIKSERVDTLFVEFKRWEEGGITGSNGTPAGMTINLHDLVSALYGIPEHRKFVSKYITFLQDGTTPGNHTETSGYAEYRELYDEIERGEENALWGQVARISWMYDVIKRGREQQRKLKEKGKEGDRKAEYDAFNYGFLVWEWDQVSEKKLFASNQEPTFFKIEKVRTGLSRLHLRFLTRGVLGTPTTAVKKAEEKALTTTAGKEVPVTFKPRIVVEKGVGFLQIFKQAKKHRIGGIETRRFKLVCCLFSPERSESGSYNPTLQNYDSVFEYARLNKDKSNSKLKSIATAQEEKLSLIKLTIKEFQKKGEVPAGAYLKFVWEGNGVRMDVISQEGLKYPS